MIVILCRQLVSARERIATGLKKLLETNELVVNMEVLIVLFNYFTIIIIF